MSGPGQTLVEGSHDGHVATKETIVVGTRVEENRGRSEGGTSLISGISEEGTFTPFDRLHEPIDNCRLIKGKAAIVTHNLNAMSRDCSGIDENSSVGKFHSLTFIGQIRCTKLLRTKLLDSILIHPTLPVLEIDQSDLDPNQLPLRGLAGRKLPALM
jgi:hypothetical protein